MIQRRDDDLNRDADERLVQVDEENDDAREAVVDPEEREVAPDAGEEEYEVADEADLPVSD